MLGCHDIPPCRKTVRANHSSPLAMKIVRSWDELGTCRRREQQPPAHPYPVSQYPIGISRNSRRVLLVRQCGWRQRGAREVVTCGFGVRRSRALRHSSAYWPTRGRHRSVTPCTDRFDNSGVRACMWPKRQERWLRVKGPPIGTQKNCQHREVLVQGDGETGCTITSRSF